MVAAPAIIAQNNRLHGIEQRQCLIVGDAFIHLFDVGHPVAIPAPRVEGAVVAGLLDRVEDVTMFDDVPAPAAVADVDAGPGQS
jgi:hypothetical protein